MIKNSTVWCRLENGGDIIHSWTGGVENLTVNELTTLKQPVFVVSNWGEFDELKVIQENHQIINLNELTSVAIIDGLSNTQASISYDEFEDHVNQIKSGISNQEYEKVVISRVFEGEHDGIDLKEKFIQLCNLYPNSMVVLLLSAEFGTWIGASPEVLISKDKDKFKIMSLAGTLFDDSEQWSKKERDEQSVTTRHIHEVLKGIKYEVSEVHEEKQGDLRHLRQWFTASANDIRVDNVLKKLVPTPAIAGYPVKTGIQEIGRLESHDRRLYSGFWGLVDNSDWHLQVNLRVAQIFKSKYNLFAGCGINSGSIAQREWDETGNKMEVVKRVLTNG